MLNQVILVGRLTSDPEVEELEDHKKVSKITLAIQRPFKNIEGTYDTDFITCSLWQGLALNLKEYCKKGSIIGVKGRIVTKQLQINENKKIFYTEIIGENITFISK